MLNTTRHIQLQRLCDSPLSPTQVSFFPRDWIPSLADCTPDCVCFFITFPTSPQNCFLPNRLKKGILVKSSRVGSSFAPVSGSASFSAPKRGDPVPSSSKSPPPPSNDDASEDSFGKGGLVSISCVIARCCHQQTQELVAMFEWSNSRASATTCCLHYEYSPHGCTYIFKKRRVEIIKKL